MSSWVFPELIRPQYPPTPDILQSALAWSLMKPKPVEIEDCARARGFVYERKTSTQPKRLRIQTTRPDFHFDSSWTAALHQCGLVPREKHLQSAVAHAIAEAIVGIAPKKGAGMTASPLGLSAALLQDPAGAMGVANPPNFALLVNQLFSLGIETSTGFRKRQSLASELWYDAIVRLVRESRLLGKIDSALFKAVISSLVELDPNAGWPPASCEPLESTIPKEAPAWWHGRDFDTRNTPYGWFADSWSNLCSSEWIFALPARRWVDWASCILRQAFAFGFLWEAHFFRTLGQFVAGYEEESLDATAARLRTPPLGLIPWANSGSISSLDIKPQLRELLRVGHACRSVLMHWQENVPAPKESTLIGMLEHLNRKSRGGNLRAALRDALKGDVKAGGLSNLIETVEYSLLCRQDRGTSADYYGFTKTVSRRFMHVAPSPEWIVVISAMAARGPSNTCRLVDVMEALQRLGLRPRIDTLVRELERAGLCASSPDGDEGILVSPAFGGSRWREN